MKNRQPVILPAYDNDDKEVEHVVLVQLGKDPSKFCQIYRKDYDQLTELGVSGNWSANNHRQVYASVARGLHTTPWRVQVVRLLAKARAGEAVRFKDGNPWNLFAENLQCFPDPQGRGNNDWLRLQDRQKELAVVKEIAEARAELEKARSASKAMTRFAVEKLAEVLKLQGSSYQRTNQSVCAGCEDTVKGCDGSCATGY